MEVDVDSVDCVDLNESDHINVIKFNMDRGDSLLVLSKSVAMPLFNFKRKQSSASLGRLVRKKKTKSLKR